MLAISSWLVRRLLRAELVVADAFLEGSNDPFTGLTTEGAPVTLTADSTLAANERLRIFHLSDLHLGSEHQGRIEALERVLRKLDPHLVIVTGDVVDKPDDRSLKIAKEVLGKLEDGRELIVVAGNHDRHGELDLNGWRRSLGITYGDYGYHFLQFPCEGKPDLPVFIFRFCSTLGAERSTDAGPLRFLERLIQVQGWVEQSQIEYFRAQARELKQRPEFHRALRIAAIHHHPLPTRRSSRADRFMTILNAPDVLDIFDELHIDLVLHGHQHDPMVQEVRRQRMGTTIRRALCRCSDESNRAGGGNESPMSHLRVLPH